MDYELSPEKTNPKPWPPAGVKWYYSDEWVAIAHADCREILPELPDNSVDLVVTSPPYEDLRDYGGFVFDCQNTAQELLKLICDGGVVVWVAGDKVTDGGESGESFRQALLFNSVGFKLLDTMIYGKDGIRYPETIRYNQQFEYMFVFCKGKPKTFNPIKYRNKYNFVKNKLVTNRNADGSLTRKHYDAKEDVSLANIWFYDVGYMKSSKDAFVFEHPAIFPEALASDHIISWSNPGDLILDPFLGSGTTAYCAKKLNRHCIGIEIEEKYCEIAAKRCSQSVMELRI